MSGLICFPFYTGRPGTLCLVGLDTRLPDVTRELRTKNRPVNDTASKLNLHLSRMRFPRFGQAEMQSESRFSLILFLFFLFCCFCFKARHRANKIINTNKTKQTNKQTKNKTNKKREIKHAYNQKTTTTTTRNEFPLASLSLQFSWKH